MSEFGQNIRSIVKKGIEAIGNSAESLAASTKQKVDIFNLSNEKTEVFCAIGSKVYELSGQGAEFPAELNELLQKAAEIENELQRLRGEKNTCENEEEFHTNDHDVPSPASACDDTQITGNRNTDIPVIVLDDVETEEEEAGEENCPLSSAINDLFENIPKVDKMMGKVNSSLDDLGESLRKFSGDLDRQISEFNDEMMCTGKESKDKDG